MIDIHKKFLTNYLLQFFLLKLGLDNNIIFTRMCLKFP